MARAFSIPPDAGIQWPPVCVACGSVPTFDAVARGTAFTRLGWWVFGYTIHYRKASLVYPACVRHLRISQVFKFLFVLGGGVAIGGVITGLLISGQMGITIATVSVPIGFMLALYSALALPVRVRPTADGGVVVTIANEIYAHEFQQANRRIFEAHAAAKRRKQEASRAFQFGQWIGRVFRGRR